MHKGGDSVLVGLTSGAVKTIAPHDDDDQESLVLGVGGGGGRVLEFRYRGEYPAGPPPSCFGTRLPPPPPPRPPPTPPPFFGAPPPPPPPPNRAAKHSPTTDLEQ